MSLAGVVSKSFIIVVPIVCSCISLGIQFTNLIDAKFLQSISFNTSNSFNSPIGLKSLSFQQISNSNRSNFYNAIVSEMSVRLRTPPNDRFSKFVSVSIPFKDLIFAVAKLRLFRLVRLLKLSTSLERKRKNLMRLGIKNEQAYAWSRTRMGGWAVTQSPILRTTITEKRLRKSEVLILRTPVYETRTYGGVRGALH